MRPSCRSGLPIPALHVVLWGWAAFVLTAFGLRHPSIPVGATPMELSPSKRVRIVGIIKYLLWYYIRKAYVKITVKLTSKLMHVHACTRSD